MQSEFEDTALCSWARHFTLTVPLSTQVYNWVLENLMLGGGLPCDGLVPPPEGRRNTLSSHPLSQVITQPSFVLYCLQEPLECLFLFKIINFVTAKKSMNFLLSNFWTKM